MSRTLYYYSYRSNYHNKFMRKILLCLSCSTPFVSPQCLKHKINTLKYRWFFVSYPLYNGFFFFLVVTGFRGCECRPNNCDHRSTQKIVNLDRHVQTNCEKVDIFSYARHVKTIATDALMHHIKLVHKLHDV